MAASALPCVWVSVAARARKLLPRGPGIRLPRVPKNVAMAPTLPAAAFPAFTAPPALTAGIDELELG